MPWLSHHFLTSGTPNEEAEGPSAIPPFRCAIVMAICEGAVSLI